MTGSGVTEEHKLNYEHQGDEAKVEVVTSAATVLVAKIKELFVADGLLSQWVEKAKERGPADFPRHRRRRRILRATNGDEAGPILAFILALLLLVLIGVGVVLFKLFALQEGQSSHERRITSLERSPPSGSPSRID